MTSHVKARLIALAIGALLPAVSANAAHAGEPDETPSAIRAPRPSIRALTLAPARRPASGATTSAEPPAERQTSPETPKPKGPPVTAPRPPNAAPRAASPTRPNAAVPAAAPQMSRRAPFRAVAALTAASIVFGVEPTKSEAPRPTPVTLRVARTTPPPPIAAAPPATKAESRPVSSAQRAAALTNANIDGAIALRRRGHDIPESMLPTEHPVVQGNKVDFLVDGPRVFPNILRDLASAKDSIHISHFAVGNDKLGKELGAILMQKAREGVEVRVLVDPAGSGDLLRIGSTESMLRNWEKAGVQVIRNFHIDPFRRAEMLNHIEHRKLYVIDGKVAYTGGMGIQEKYRSEWHDVMVRVEGEGTRQMQVDFVKTWQHLGGRIDQRGGTDAELRARFFPEPGRPGDVALQADVQIPGESPRIRDAYLTQIRAAQRTLYIENPYVTDRRILNALEDAAGRGVDVRVVVPRRSDLPITLWAARGWYDRLLKAGVHVYEYDGMTHAKVAVRDGEWSTVGSSNLDSLSMNHNYEFNYATTNRRLANEIEGMVKTDMAHSTEVTRVNIASKLLGKLLDLPFVSYFL